jgi:hypothetical protein
VDARTGRLVAGDQDTGYGLSLADVQAVLDAGPRR